MSKMVIKRSGKEEKYDNAKVNRPVMWACKGIDDVYPSDILIHMEKQLPAKTTTEDVHKALINASVNLISEETPQYSKVAARLLIFSVRKRAYGSFIPPSLKTHIETQVNAGRYASEILNSYTDDEFDEINRWVDHTRDMTLEYIAARQLEKKYLLQNRVTGDIYESPQYCFMIIGMTLFSNLDKNIRLDYIKRYYDAISTYKISLPTPIMAGARTPSRQFSSCVVVDCGDSLDSIIGSTGAVMRYIASKSGIGYNFGRIRAIGSPIRNGEAYHTGLFPFIKQLESTVGSCSQGGVRNGSATSYLPWWHFESQMFINCKNNKGTEANRARSLDYTVQMNGFFFKRFSEEKDIALFSPSDVPGLYDAFFQDQQLFAELYEKYESDPSIRRNTVKAKDLLIEIAVERAGTGRIYLQFVDHSNDNSPFNKQKAPIYLSNLCLEILLPTTPVTALDASDGEIALCTLAAFNVGAIESLDELENLADILVVLLNELLDYQEYPLQAARKGGQGRRSLGLGVTGYATYLARNKSSYSDDKAPVLTHQLFEAIQYFALKASNNWAKHKGPCPLFNDTTYVDGVLPIDRYNKNVDSLVDTPYLQDWESLRADIKEYGLANSTVTALMPCETSSAVTNSINGIEPPRGFITYKGNKDAIMPQVVPDVGYPYEYVWDMESNIPYLRNVAIMQKFVDQTISTNVNHDPSKEPDGKTSINKVIQEIAFSYRHGLKTMYYHNTRDGNDLVETMDAGCEGGVCKI